MRYKKSNTKTENFFPDNIPPCEFMNGTFYVPPEWEVYYTSVWAWKRARKLRLEVYKLQYLEDYEAKYGKVTQWQDNHGNLRPIFLLA